MRTLAHHWWHRRWSKPFKAVTEFAYAPGSPKYRRLERIEQCCLECGCIKVIETLSDCDLTKKTREAV